MFIMSKRNAPNCSGNRRTEARKLFGLFSLLLALIIAGFLSPRSTCAHEGEEHGGPPAPLPGVSNVQSPWAQSENFELVAKYSLIEPGKEAVLDLYLSDFATNAPIGNAAISATISGNDSLSVRVEAEKTPGLYVVKLLFPKAGTYDLLFDIIAGENADLMEIKGIQVGKPANVAAVVKSRPSFLLIVFSTVGLALIAGLFLFIRNHNNRKRAAISAGLIVTLLTFSIPPAPAHEGEEHGAQKSAQVGASTPGYLSKGSQFLLGVRTVPAKTRTVSRQLRVLGRVIPRPTGLAEVFSPQAGRLITSDEVIYPRLGDRVQKGQPIAAVQILDQFLIRAPIDGVVTEVHAVPGEQVDPSRNLFTIVDFNVVWVEANLFEGDLALMEPQPPASITTDAYPRVTFAAHFVNFSNILDPSTRTIKVTYEVPNPNQKLRVGMLVNCNVETEKKSEALAVPAGAVLDWEGTRVVFVHTQPELFEMRPIQVAGYYGEWVAVQGGVGAGDRVVTTGAYQLLNMPHRLAGAGY